MSAQPINSQHSAVQTIHRPHDGQHARKSSFRAAAGAEVRSRGGDVVFLSRAAVAQSVPGGAQSAVAKAQPLPSASPTKPAGLGASPLTGAPAGAEARAQETPLLFGQATLDAIRDRFGATLGSENYSAEADADGDGVIDYRDITHTLANWGRARS